jgi:hypothetical protein
MSVDDAAIDPGQQWVSVPVSNQTSNEGQNFVPEMAQ